MVSKKCFRCDQTGPLQNDEQCPAKDKVCHKCHKMGHFAAVCKTKLDTFKRTNYHPSKRGGMQRPQRVDYLVEDDGYTFSVSEDHVQSVEDGTINITVGGAHIKDILIDSGASCNIIDKQTWEDLKRQGIKCESKKETQKVFPYGSRKPLETLGKFNFVIQFNKEETEAEFMISGKG